MCIHPHDAIDANRERERKESESSGGRFFLNKEDEGVAYGHAPSKKIFRLFFSKVSEEMI